MDTRGQASGCYIVVEASVNTSLLDQQLRKGGGATDIWKRGVAPLTITGDPAKQISGFLKPETLESAVSENGEIKLIRNTTDELLASFDLRAVNMVFSDLEQTVSGEKAAITPTYSVFGHFLREFTEAIDVFGLGASSTFRGFRVRFIELVTLSLSTGDDDNASQSEQYQPCTLVLHLESNSPDPADADVNEQWSELPVLLEDNIKRVEKRKVHLRELQLHLNGATGEDDPLFTNGLFRICESGTASELVAECYPVFTCLALKGNLDNDILLARQISTTTFQKNPGDDEEKKNRIERAKGDLKELSDSNWLLPSGRGAIFLSANASTVTFEPLRFYNSTIYSYLFSHILLAKSIYIQVQLDVQEVLKGSWLREISYHNSLDRLLTLKSKFESIRSTVDSLSLLGNRTSSKIADALTGQLRLEDSYNTIDNQIGKLEADIALRRELEADSASERTERYRALLGALLSIIAVVGVPLTFVSDTHDLHEDFGSWVIVLAVVLVIAGIALAGYNIKRESSAKRKY